MESGNSSSDSLGHKNCQTQRIWERFLDRRIPMTKNVEGGRFGIIETLEQLQVTTRQFTWISRPDGSISRNEKAEDVQNQASSVVLPVGIEYHTKKFSGQHFQFWAQTQISRFIRRSEANFQNVWTRFWKFGSKVEIFRWEFRAHKYKLLTVEHRSPTSIANQGLNSYWIGVIIAENAGKCRKIFYLRDRLRSFFSAPNIVPIGKNSSPNLNREAMDHCVLLGRLAILSEKNKQTVTDFSMNWISEVRFWRIRLRKVSTNAMTGTHATDLS